MNIKSALFAALFFPCLTVGAQVRLGIDASSPGVKVSPDLYGIFYEDINNAADGGLYAELVRNRSFEDNDQKPEYWEAYNGAQVRLVSQTKQQLNSAQRHALEVEFTGKGRSGVSNAGFWGIPIVQGRTYRLSFWAKGKLSDKLVVYLGCACGRKMKATTEIADKITGKWTRYTATFTADVTDPSGLLFITSEGKGKVLFDVVSLFPPTFKNRENGMRPDLASMIANMRPKFMRFPGGCFVEGQESPANAFHWEETVGPIETRPGHKNVNWGYRTTDGLGYHEYLQLAEDIGAKPLFVVNVGLWHGGLTPVDSLQPWVDEALAAIEYANGPVTSKYGAMRAKNGHPEPFNLEYLEIGNENNQPDPRQQSDRYYDRFKIFKDAILAKYPNMHLIGNVVAWGDDNPKWESNEPVELLDEHYYRNPAWFAENFHKYDFYERGRHGIYVGEYAVTQGFGKMGSLNAALGEAVFMMGMENNSDVVKMASYAPLYANLNRRVWAPDMIQFDGTRVFGTPSYYVQKLMFTNLGTRVLKVDVDNPYQREDYVEPVSPHQAQYGFATWNTQASFETADDVKGVSGTWEKQGNVVSQKAGGESLIALAGDKQGTRNHVFKVRARKDKGAEGFMIVFNYTDPNNYCWVNFGGWGNTQHGIEQVVDGSKMQTATRRGKIEEGKWYDVELQQHGDSVKVLLDGALVFDVKLKQNSFSGIFSSATLDEPTGNVIVKIANTGRRPTTAEIDLKGLTPGQADVVRLTSASGSDENTLEQPLNVSPSEEVLSPADGRVLVDIPAYSLNIVRIKK